MSCFFLHVLQKYSFWLDHTNHHSITLLGIFPYSFTDRANVPISRRRTLSQPIIFGLVVPDITTKITRACAHLKPVTRPKTFSGLKIIWMHNQYAFVRFEKISAYRSLVC